uniref:DNA-binding response regulator n=1 Tax=Thermosporothrix sp. COM3 TaxID=2490863 RepID=A0A455SGJ8_9CHLR|nr:DNA-binding response regulator [Thermosporothrix sp. COM3]
MPEKTKVMLVDDHRIVRRGLYSFLKAFDDMEVVGEVSSGEEALKQLDRWMPDVVVMDLLMPGGMDGIEAIKQIHEQAPNIRIVALTSSTEETRVMAALRAGAIGYVRKDADPEMLLASIRAAARGQSLLDPSVAGAVMQELMRTVKQPSKLTERELQVLQQLAMGRTNVEIAAALGVSEETIKTHVGNILTKLQLAHRTQAVIYALKRGLLSLDDIELP